MRRILLIALSFGLVFSGAAAALDLPTEKIDITGKNTAAFSHSIHLELNLACGECHHNSEHKPLSDEEVLAQSDGSTLHCKYCHNENFMNEKLRNLRYVMHSHCKGCHKVGVNGVKGPLRCVKCHKKKPQKQ